MKNRNFRILFLIVFSLVVLTIAPGGKTQNEPVAPTDNKKPPMFVLQVGIENYKSSKYPRLKGAKFDIDGMREVLTGERFKIPAENIKSLTDGEATKENIFAAYEKYLTLRAKEYFEKTGRRDAVALFQFSGHGSQTPDGADADEADGLDETFVTVNSEDAPGKNFDITDDEIYRLTKRLGKYTENIVFILDSCHSGSGTRDAGDTRRVKPRATAPVAVPMPGENTRSLGGETEKKSEPDNFQTDLLPFSKDYIVISAARAEQLAGQTEIFEGESRYPTAYYGKLTFFLLKGLREAGPQTTYRELMDNVIRELTGKYGDSQIPQIEGETRRPVFGELSVTEDNSIEISKAETGRLVIAAGAMQGIVKGMILDILDRDKKKIGTAKIAQTAAATSVASVVASLREPTTDDRVSVVSTDLVASRLRVLLDGEDSAKLSAADRQLVSKLRRKFTPDKTNAAALSGISLATGKWNDQTARWDVALLKDSFGKVFPDKARAAPVIIGKDEAGRDIYDKFPPPDRQVFYLAGRDFVPLYGFYVEADREYTERTIEKALLQLTRLRSVKAIANQRSTLFGKVTVQPVRLIEPENCAEISTVFTKTKIPDYNTVVNAYEFKAGEAFWLEIANTSNKDLYITLLNIGSDGSVKILFPGNTDGEMEGFKLEARKGRKIVPGEKCRDGYLMVAPPAGIETFKVIATTEKTARRNFEFLEMKSLNERAARGDETSLLGVGEWTTAEINFEITTAKE